MIRTHAKTKIELVIEASILATVLELLVAENAPGYTVVPAIAGLGHDGPWQEHELSGAERKLLVIVVVGGDRAERLIETLYEVLQPYSAILYASEVRVIREEHF